MQHRSLTNLLLFLRNISYVFGINLYTVSSLSLAEPRAQSLLRKVILGTDLSQFLQYSLLRIRDGGTLPEQVSRIRVREPDSSRIVV
jgi:hypothetical protein